MAAAGVPVVPGYDGDDQDDATLAAEAARIGWPVMIKPSRGGGGKGMRVVTPRRGLRAGPRRLPPRGRARPSATTSWSSSASWSGRATSRSRCWPTPTATCSTSSSASARSSGGTRRWSRRRPSPALDPGAAREALCAAGVAAARAARYVNAGTVEFLLDPGGPLLLPRDEHAAPGGAPGDRGRDWRSTWCACRSRSPRGSRCPAARQDVVARGHALECRLYAEDPENDDLPVARDASSTWRLPRARASASTRASRRGSEVTRPLRSAARQGRHLGPGPRRVRRAHARRAARARPCWASSPTSPACGRSSPTRRSGPATSTRASSTSIWGEPAPSPWPASRGHRRRPGRAPSRHARRRGAGRPGARLLGAGGAVGGSEADRVMRWCAAKSSIEVELTSTVRDGFEVVVDGPGFRPGRGRGAGPGQLRAPRERPHRWLPLRARRRRHPPLLARAASYRSWRRGRGRVGPRTATPSGGLEAPMPGKVIAVKSWSASA